MKRCLFGKSALLLYNLHEMVFDWLAIHIIANMTVIKLPMVTVSTDGHGWFFVIIYMYM